MIDRMELKCAARSRWPILLYGPPGSGKTHVAKEIHELSRRSDGPWVPVNCATIPEGLLASELFGHVRGAFSDAVRNRPGKFRAADGGTLFLDELGAAPDHLQAALLKVLEDGLVVPVGADQGVKVDVRVIAATNALENVRDDLRDRLASTWSFEMLPFAQRSRRDRDVILAELLERVAAEQGDVFPEGLTLAACARDAIDAHGWPGNVRELEGVLRAASVFSDRRDSLDPSSHGVIFGCAVERRIKRAASPRVRAAEKRAARRAEETPPAPVTYVDATTSNITQLLIVVTPDEKAVLDEAIAMGGDARPIRRDALRHVVEVRRGLSREVVNHTIGSLVAAGVFVLEGGCITVTALAKRVQTRGEPVGA